MKVNASAKYLRISPRKVRIVIPLIKNKKTSEAVSILDNTHKKAARFLLTVLHNGIASAKGKKMNVEELIVSDVRADGGPIFKRIMTRAMGRADRLCKRTTHIRMELSEEVSSDTTAQPTNTRTRR